MRKRIEAPKPSYYNATINFFKKPTQEFFKCKIEKTENFVTIYHKEEAHIFNSKTIEEINLTKYKE